MRWFTRIAVCALFLWLFPNLNFAQVDQYNYRKSSFMIQTLLDSVNIDSIYQTERHLTGEEPFWINGQLDSIKSRHSVGEGIQKAQNYIQNRLEKMGYFVELQPFKLGIYDLNNIIVTKIGTVYPDQFYILGAHYDSTSPFTFVLAPGADDNGSGTATVVEAARVLKNINFEYSIKFILFSGEEQGLNGSKFYAKNASGNNENIIGMINLDMIGYDSNEDGVFEIHTGYLTESQEMGDLFSNNVTAFGLSLLPQIVSGSQSTSSSDHSPFWNNNYPAVLIIEDFSYDFNRNYHSSEDLLSNLNKEYFFDLARLSIGSLATLAGLDTIASGISEQLLVEDYKLFSPYPNPFGKSHHFGGNSSVNIQYQIADFETITLKIFDSLGRSITTLVEKQQNPGNYLMSWNGVDEQGNLVSSGIYFVTLQAGSFLQKQKIILMR